MRGCGWTLRKARTVGTSTRRRHSGTRLGSAEVPQIQFIDFVVVEAEPGYIIKCQSTEVFGLISYSGVLLALFALGKWCIIPL